MQGDLISRSAAIDVIWDVFNQYCNDSDRFDEYETEAINRAFKRLQSTLEKQPTAYDADKVVEQLKNMKDLHEGLSKAEKLSKEDKYIHTLCHGLCVKVIDIVRAGGKE